MPDPQLQTPRWARWLVAERAVPFVIAALGICTFFPALITPRFLDDYLHALMIDGKFPVQRSPFNLYDFIDDGNRALFAERGLLPWWVQPDLQLRFLRPLSSAVLWAEQRILHLGLGLRHVHSFAWWLCAVLGARSLLRRLLPQRTALLGTLVFAFAPCHALPLGWIANRNALLSLCLGIWALAAYLDWRDKPAWRSALATLTLFSAALLAGEYALCFGGYVAAIELTRTREGIARRALAALPFAVPVAAYLAARHALDYGAIGSGFYVDPLAEPWAFLLVVPLRLASLLAQGWLTVDPDIWLFDPWNWLLYPSVLAAILATALLLRRAYAALPDEPRANATWLLVGSVLAIIPVLPTFPSARLMGIALLGIAANIGILFDHAWFPERPVARTRSVDYAGIAVVLLGFAHFIHGPVTSWLAVSRVQRDASRFEADVARIGKRLDELGASEVVVLRGAVDAFFGPFAQVVAGGAWARWDILSDPGHMLALRHDERTLELITSPESSLFPLGGLNLFRAPEARMKAGDEFETKNFKLQVVATRELGPTRARVTFQRPLEERRLWVWRQNGGLRELEPPEQGFGLPSDP